MKKVITLGLIGLMLIILDNSVVPFFAFRGYYPSLAFVFIVCYSIVNGSSEGIWIGLFCGLFQDLYFFTGFGINSLTNILICALAGVFGLNLFKQKIIIPVISIFVFSIIKGIMIFVIMYFFRISISVQGVVTISIYNLIIAFIFYKTIYKFCSKEFMKVKWKF